MKATVPQPGAKKPQSRLFAKRFNTVLRSIISQRQRLIKDGTTGIHKDLMNPIIERLHRYVNYAFTDIGAARFLLTHQRDIKYLVPRNKAGESRLLQLDTLITAAQILIQNHERYAH